MGSKGNDIVKRRVTVCGVSREGSETKNLKMFDGKSPLSILHIERLKLRILHSPQPLQVFDHLGVVFILDWFTGSFVDGPASVQFHPRSDVQSGPRRRFVDVIQIGVDAALLILEPHEVSKQLFDASRSGEVDRIQERDFTIPDPAGDKLLDGD